VRDPKSDPSLAKWFGKIVTKSRDYLWDKGNNFVPLFKLYKQRLFSTLYPVLMEMLSIMDQGTEECKSRHCKAVQLMM
jgi:hypothetical protein